MNIKRALLLILIPLSFSADGKSATARATLYVSDSVEISTSSSSKNNFIVASSRSIIMRKNKMISIIENNKTRTVTSGSSGEIKSNNKQMIELFL